MSEQTEPSGSNVLIIACKTPHGLKMELGRPGEEGYETHTIKGIAQKGAVLNESGFAITRVPRDFWDKWLAFSPRGTDGKVIAKEPNKRLDCIKRGFIFAAPEAASVDDYTRSVAKLRTGLEALDPSKLPKGLETLKRIE